MLDILAHPHPERYAEQRIFVVRRDDYVYLVPFVEDEETVFAEGLPYQTLIASLPHKYA